MKKKIETKKPNKTKQKNTLEKFMKFSEENGFHQTILIGWDGKVPQTLSWGKTPTDFEEIRRLHVWILAQMGLINETDTLVTSKESLH